MKKYIKRILFSTLGLGLLISCQAELDNFNDNPNDPTTTTPSLLLSAMEVSTFSTQTSGLIRTTSIFDQHLAGTNLGQLGEIASYVLKEGDVNNEWNTVYGTTLISGHILNRDFATEYPYYNGIGQILTAVNLSYITDLWGDVPYDEAFLADEGNRSPKFNTQEEIYQRLQTILDNAIANLKKPESTNLSIPSDDDFIFQGNTAKWIKVAYVLKARFALRLTERDTDAATKALNYITLSGMTSNNDDANTYFPGTSNGQNQWYAFDISRKNYLKMGAFFVDELKSTSDPRLTFAVALNKPKVTVPATTPTYVGNTPEDLSTTTTSYIGSAFASANSSIGIVTYAEAKFIEAEAKLRLNQNARPALEAAIAASVLKITGTAATPMFISSVTQTINLPTIIQQKYNALFLTMEPYNDYRRTGLPVLVPNQDSNTKKIPVRFPTPSDERNYNPNATVVSDVTTNLWWDKD